MNTSAPSRSRLLAWLQLFRLPNVFTAMADICMGYFFIHGIAIVWPVFLSLLAASSLLYTAGMVLNDVFDVEVDRRERPGRPLPSGQIGVGQARLLGFSMLALGVALAILAGLLAPASTPLPWRSGGVALVLAACILLYDGLLKTTAVAPLVMGGCRFLNVLLGMSIAPLLMVDDIPRLAGYDASQLLVAGGMGTYIVGVTLFARSEAVEQSSRWLLSGGVVVMMLGFALLAIFPQYGEFLALRRLRFHVSGMPNDMVWPLLLLLLAFTIVRRCMVAVRRPEPHFVQAAVKHAILSLIVINAAIVLAVTADAVLAVGTLCLLVPTLLFGRWVYST